MFKYIQKSFSFLKVDFLESSCEGGGEGYEQPNRNKLSPEEIQEAKKAIDYLLNSGESFSCVKFQEGGEFYKVRKRVMEIVGRRFSEGNNLDVITRRYEALGLKDTSIIGFFSGSSNANDVIPMKKAKKALLIGEQQMRDTEDKIVSRIVKLDINARRRFLQENPEKLSQRILSSCFPDIETLLLSDGKLSKEFITFLDAIIPILATRGERNYFLQYLKQVESRFSSFEGVLNKISSLKKEINERF